MADKNVTIIFDQKEEAKKREQHMKINNISKSLRERGNKNLYRTVQAVLDPESMKLFHLNSQKDTDKAVCEVFFPGKETKDLTDDYCNRIIKATEATLTIDGYKVLKSVLFRDPKDTEKVVGKILISVS